MQENAFFFKIKLMCEKVITEKVQDVKTPALNTPGDPDSVSGVVIKRAINCDKYQIV